MTQASEKITQQYIDGGVIPAHLVGQDAVSKTYVDGQLAIRDTRITDAKNSANKAQASINDHEASTKAHPAQNITYSGDIIGASNVKQALDNTKQTIDDLILGSGDSGPEVAAARGGYPTLGDRLDASDEQLTDVEKDMDRPFVGRQKTVKTDDQYNCWPVLVKTKTNRFISIYASGPSHKQNGNGPIPGRTLNYKYSDNDGLTWSDEITMLYDKDTDYTTFGALAISNGDIICFVNKNIVSGGVTVSTDYLVMKSVDNGLNFTEVFRFSDSTDAMTRLLGYPNVPVEMDNGQIIANKHNYSGDYVGLGFVFSHDGGVTWNDSVTVIEANNYTSLDQIPWELRIAYIGDGKLIAIGRNNIGNVYQLNSSDYGRTWTQYTTNISDCKANCLFPLYFSNDDTLTLYYNDRLSNTIKKRTVSATFIYNNPNLWADPTIIDYTSSNATGIDSGYITACRIRDFRDETILCMYTTRDIRVGVDDPKKAGIVVVYDSVGAPNTPVTKENLFINGGMSVWQFGTSFNPSSNVAQYVASQWIFKGDGTNVVSRSLSNVYNKRSLLINAASSASYYRLYQPLLGLSKNNVYTMTARLNAVDAIKARLYVKWTENNSIKENSTLAKEVSVSGVRNVSFTFNKPTSDLGTPVYIGIEMEGKTSVQVLNMKLEEGYTFTGINEVNDDIETDKCLLYYEELTGTMSFVARNDGNLMQTLYFSQKSAVPTVNVQWAGNNNTVRAWDGADAGNTSVTINTGRNFVRFYGNKPAGKTPVYYDADKIIIDARIPV